MMVRVLTVLLLVLYLAGCVTLAPRYQRPAAPVPAEWPQGEAYQKITAVSGVPTVKELSLWEFFTDRRLQKIIEMSLKNNLDLQLAALNVEKARAIYGVKRAELFPSVNAVGSKSKQRIPKDVMGFPQSLTIERYNVSLGIASWEVDFFGRIRSLKKKALEEYLATEEARRSAQISLVSEVARAYFTLAADRENLKLARDTLETRQHTYELIRRQYEVGLANELDLRRAQTQVDAARGDVARYTQLVAQDENALNLLAGAPLPEDLLPPDLAGVSPPRDISPGLSSEVLLGRPDIMAAEHQLRAAYANIGAARAAFFPRISLTASIGTASSELSGLFGSGSKTWNFAPQAVLPIFDPRIWAAHRVSKADRKIVLTQYEKAIQKAFREVADTLAVEGTVDDRLSAQQSLVNAAAETYRLSLVRYTKGIDSYLSVLDAQRSLFVAQEGLIMLRLAKLSNQVMLYAVLGGGGE
ncbi:MAG: multidrug transporter [Desulfobacteraceae bacterium 4484_190.1]|nr:MAG: multidrug transporter [Desulfobacteraceae bacterium 4484_190.1]